MLIHIRLLQNLNFLFCVKFLMQIMRIS